MSSRDEDSCLLIATFKDSANDLLQDQHVVVCGVRRNFTGCAVAPDLCALAVGLRNQRTSLFIGEDWSHLPVKALRPLGRMLVAGVRTVGFDKNPTLNRARPVKALP